MLVKIIPNCVVSFEVRTTISCNSRLIRNNFSYAISDHLLNSFGIRVRYGYPFANQTSIKLVIDFSSELKMYGSTYNVVTFAFTEEFEAANINAADVKNSSLCKLVYTGAVKGERPDITISDCND